MSANRPQTILGIETSCDECSAAVIEHRDNMNQVKSLVTHSQIEIHQTFGGVVPEVASRNHLQTIVPMIDQAIRQAGIQATDLNGIAVTNRPGLVGALLVGVNCAKTLAYALGLPLIPIHHLEGHIASLFIDRDPQDFTYPMMVAVVSGGHTNLHLVEGPPSSWGPEFLKESLVAYSIDDAAGEAFDKTAKALGLDYPGGRQIDEHSEGGNPRAFDFPRPMTKGGNPNFSFSGLKTAVAFKVREVREEQGHENIEGQLLKDLCASIQAAIVDVLTLKLKQAAQEYACRSIGIVGGVSANRLFRARLHEEFSIPNFTAAREYCTDNAAMIAAAGVFRHEQSLRPSSEEFFLINALASAEF